MGRARWVCHFRWRMRQFLQNPCAFRTIPINFLLWTKVRMGTLRGNSLSQWENFVKIMLEIADYLHHFLMKFMLFESEPTDSYSEQANLLPNIVSHRPMDLLIWSTPLYYIGVARSPFYLGGGGRWLLLLCPSLYVQYIQSTSHDCITSMRLLSS